MVVMKKLLPALLFLLLAYTGCKKDQTAQPNPAGDTTNTGSNGKTGTSGPALGTLSTNVVTSGMLVNLSGSNLPTSASDIKVSFNGVDAPVQFSSLSGLIVKVPVTTSGNIKAVIGDQTLTGPAFTYVAAPAVTAISPTMITTGTVVTLTGTNFQAEGLSTSVSFNGAAAVIQSISATEIKVVAPKTSNGLVRVSLTPNISGLSPAYTYTSPALLVPYVSGDVTLASQSDVDAFTAVNKGRQLQITGDLNISGADVTSVSGLANITSVSGKIYINNAAALSDAPFLNTITHAGSIYFVYTGLTNVSFNNLTDFTGGIYLSSLDKLTHVSFSNLSTPAYVYIHYVPLLTDLSFMSKITATSGISLIYSGATSLKADNLATMGNLELQNCAALSTVSFRSLTATTSENLLGIVVSQCTALKHMDLTALSTVAGKFSLSGTSLTDMNGFAALTRAGSLTLLGNDELADLQGLKRLTAVTLAATTGGLTYGSVNINGINIALNPKLTSLNGLQNVATLPLLTIRNNTALNDLCPLKKQILAMNALPAYTYRYIPCCAPENNSYLNGSTAALTLTANGNYATAQNALDALSQCP